MEAATGHFRKEIMYEPIVLAESFQAAIACAVIGLILTLALIAASVVETREDRR